LPINPLATLAGVAERYVDGHAVAAIFTKAATAQRGAQAASRDQGVRAWPFAGLVNEV